MSVLTQLLTVLLETSIGADEKERRTHDATLRRQDIIMETLDTIKAQLAENTATLTGKLQQAVDTLQEAAAAAFAALAAQIAALKGQPTVSQADLDALGAALDEQATAFAAITEDVADTPVPVVEVDPPVTP